MPRSGADDPAFDGGGDGARAGVDGEDFSPDSRCAGGVGALRIDSAIRFRGKSTSTTLTITR